MRPTVLRSTPVTAALDQCPQCVGLLSTHWIRVSEREAILAVQVGELETKDATRWRIKWYAGMSVMSMLGVARVKGILA